MEPVGTVQNSQSQLLGILNYSEHSEELIVKCCGVLTLVFFLLHTMGISMKFEYWDITLICILSVTHHLNIFCRPLAS